jgi:pimeloyl-ACP methyl ester carboxylesterase
LDDFLPRRLPDGATGDHRAALLVYGSESNFYPQPTGTYVRDSTPSAELLVYEGADHSPHLAEPDPREPLQKLPERGKGHR